MANLKTDVTKHAKSYPSPPPVTHRYINQQVITDKILFYNSMTFACSEKKSETIQALYIGKELNSALLPKPCRGEVA